MALSLKWEGWKPSLIPLSVFIPSNSVEQAEMLSEAFALQSRLETGLVQTDTPGKAALGRPPLLAAVTCW